jgi:hypothetical protein
MTAQSAALRRTIMTTFAIDQENAITAFATAEEAAAATTTRFDTFASEKELAELAKAWPAERLVAIFNSLTGVTPVESFKSSKAATSRIWKRIQGLGDAANPETEAAKPKAHKKAKGRAQSAKDTPAKGKTTKKATPPKKAPKAAKKTAKTREAGSPREGSKTELVIGLLKRKGGATLADVMQATGWLSHTTRAFVSATLGKKLGLAVESFKPEGGERTYRLNK